MNKFQAILFKHQDLKYKDFSAKLIKDSSCLVIGVRSPILRSIAKEYSGDAYKKEFMQDLPHEYHEENMLHAYFIEGIKEYKKATKELDAFLPYMNNWAVSDSFKNKVFFNKENREDFYLKLLKYLQSSKEYTARFAIVSLFEYILDDSKIDNIIKSINEVKLDTYYINMAKAWFFCETIIKQYDKAIVLFEKNKSKKESVFSKWIHNKAIQKCTESFRVSDEQKAILRSLKIK